MRKIIFAVIGLFLATVSSVQAFEIVATVNDEVISDYDIDMRLKMMQVLMKTPITEQTKKQVLDTLILEKIKKHEAGTKGISVAEGEIKEGLSFLEKQNGMEPGTLQKILKEEDVSFDTLENQITADLLWLKILQSENEEPPVVTEKEVNARLDEIKKEMMKPTYLLAEIYIPFGSDKAAAEEQAQSLFDRVVKGEVFPELAAQFSKGKTASMGGDLGWVSSGALEKAVDRILEQMEPGQMSKPIEGEKGYYLILMRDKQKALTSTDVEAWSVAQLLLPKGQKDRISDQLAKTDGNPQAFTSLAMREGLKGSGLMPEMPVPRMPDQLYELLKDAPVKKIVGPIEANDFDLFLMKCDKRTVSVLPKADMIKKQLEMEKMEQRSEKKLQELKKKAVIEKK